MALALTSTAFTHNGPIPKLYTCQGKDISPALDVGLPDLKQPAKIDLMGTYQKD